MLKSIMGGQMQMFIKQKKCLVNQILNFCSGPAATELPALPFPSLPSPFLPIPSLTLPSLSRAHARAANKPLLRHEIVATCGCVFLLAAAVLACCCWLLLVCGSSCHLLLVFPRRCFCCLFEIVADCCCLLLVATAYSCLNQLDAAHPLPVCFSSRIPARCYMLPHGATCFRF